MPLDYSLDTVIQRPANYGPQLVGSTSITTGTAGNVNYTEYQWREWNQLYTLVSATSLSTATTTGICSYQFSGKHAAWPFNTTVTAASSAGAVTWGVWNNRFERIMEAGGHQMAAQIARYSRRKLTEE